jgi:DNA-binding transcriptional LysR family regulator
MAQVVETGSISAAARERDLSQAAAARQMSRQVARIELREIPG